MESPLNTAHQHARKSELLIKNGKYPEAIQCHTEAAECILQAMTLTGSNHALESLKLQHGYHLKKIDQLEEQCLREERKESKRLSKGGDNMVNKESQTDNIEASIFDAVADEPSYEYDNVYQTMTETDTLLNFLDKRKTCFETTSGIPAKIHSKAPIKYIKQPKDSQTIIEELSIHNDNLRGHIEQLLNEIDSLKAERDNFQKIVNNKTGQTPLTNDLYERHFSQEDFYDLPPLEMPTLGPEFYDDASKSENSTRAADSLTCKD
ncbi:hypothetical protein LOTGIDRAFT_155891 [Lottia gigantea]|uniref:Nuclear receptor-binding factor 2 MIT domain-containing protein n=1 Tax=Lottia gigantea TaxID=225164 RepID=V3ZPS6_LOTGI|nr:hypothetical protein LOTGIDRAFT_155891 [Lottia gigantea]ESO82856.1 hypothetical protein LOTGIDRAFT_155891 [Lottia gigantea]